MSDKLKASLERAIQTGIDSALKEMHTCLPAVVISVDNANHLLDAQVTIKRKLNDELVLLPVLKNVPIRHLRTSVCSITMPIKEGDHVLIIFSERSIDTWLTEGGIQNPFDVRKFSLSDAFAFPMMYSQKELSSETIDSDNLEIKLNDDSSKIIVKEAGGVEIVTDGEAKVDSDTLVGIATTSAIITTPLLTVVGNLTVTGTISGNIMAATTSLTVAGKEQGAHTHAQGNDDNGDVEQDTGPPL